MNSKPEETVQKFIDLRAKGWTFSRIAAELNVSSGTLVNWSRKYERELKNARQLRLEERNEALNLTRERSREYLSEDLRRVREELAKRDLSQLSTGRLMMLSLRLRDELDHVAGPVHLSKALADDEMNIDEALRPIVDWEV